MTITSMVRFKVDPADTDELLRRRVVLIDVVRRRFPGLTEARLARLDTESWLDAWRWESAEDLERAGAAQLPEAAAAFALARDVAREVGVVVDER
jgi:hypothetical protein